MGVHLALQSRHRHNVDGVVCGNSDEAIKKRGARRQMPITGIVAPIFSGFLWIVSGKSKGASVRTAAGVIWPINFNSYGSISGILQEPDDVTDAQSSTPTRKHDGGSIYNTAQ